MGFLFLLNNDIAFNKPILKLPVPPKDAFQLGGLRMMGFSSTPCIFIKKGDIKLLFYGKQCDQNSCDFFIELYIKYGFDYMLQYITDEFFLVLIDENIHHPESKIYVARDRLGRCPFYVLKETNTNECKNVFGFSTRMSLLEMDRIYETKFSIQEFDPDVGVNDDKVLSAPKRHSGCLFAKQTGDWLRTDAVERVREGSSWTQLGVCRRSEALESNGSKVRGRSLNTFEPGTYSYFTYSHNVLSHWKPVFENKPFFVGWKKMVQPDIQDSIKKIQNSIKESILADLPPEQTQIACLFSGGINSSIIAKYLRENSRTRTFTVGFGGSDDLKYAEKIAIIEEYDHTNIPLSEEQYIRAIPTVINILETDDVATIRYGTALYLLLNYIYENTEIRDIFTGDGANEVMGGYLNFCSYKTAIEFDYECIQLLKRYHKTGALYKKLFTHFGMRWYRPFLNDAFVDMYMEIPLEMRYRTYNDNPFIDTNKSLLRTAFINTDFIPKEIILRTPEPGYDSISSHYRRTEHIIADGLKNPEYEYYKDIFEKKFPHAEQNKNPNREPSMRNTDIYVELNIEYQDRCL